MAISSAFVDTDAIGHRRDIGSPTVVIVRQRVRPEAAGPMTSSGGRSSKHGATTWNSAITGCPAFEAVKETGCDLIIFTADYYGSTL